MKTQEGLILAALKRGKSITPMDALRWWGCFRLAARVQRLRSVGYSIVTQTESRNGKRYARYRMEA